MCDQDKLSNDKSTIGAIEEAGLSQEEIIAAIGTYKKGKQKKNPQRNVEHTDCVLDFCGQHHSVT